jgi:prepilin-type N-terminal cleavage/methylation domain-containing protein
MRYSIPKLPPRRGFTLIEAALTIVIVGVGIVSIFELFASMTRQNVAAARATSAMFLANNVQEMMADLPFNDPSGAGFGTEESGGVKSFDDVDDFNGWNSNPGSPVDSLRNELPELKNFAQRVTVTHVSVDAPTSSQIGTEAARVTVRVFHGWTANDPGQELYKMSWIAMRR